MSELESFYLGVEAELNGAERTDSRRRSPEQRLREEMRPVIAAAQQKMAEKVLVEVTGDNWRARALCFYTDPITKEKFTGGNKQDTIRAKLVCASCDVRDQCLSYALENYETTNVYGGMSEAERRSARRADRMNQRAR